MKKHLSVIAAISLAMLPAVPVAAQETSASPEAIRADPFLRLVMVINASADDEVLLDRAIEQTRSALVSGNAEVAALETQFPGVIDAMIGATRPIIRRHSQRVTANYRQQAAVMLSQILTETEARDATDFYSSPIGRRMISSIQGNMSYSGVASDVAATVGSGNIVVSEEAVAADFVANSRATMNAISEADMAQVNRDFANATWPPKLLAAQPQMIALRAEMENTPMLPQDEADMETVVRGAVQRFIAGKS